MGGVCATSEVEEAAGVVGEEDVGARGTDTIKLAIEDSVAEVRGSQGGGSAEAAANLGFLERDDLGTGEAADEFVDGVATTEDVGTLAKAVDGDRSGITAGEATVGKSSWANKVVGEVVDAALEGAGTSGPDGVPFEEALVVVKHGDGTGG
jgi:hypothetical protein